MLRQSRGQIFLFAAEKTGVLHPLWLMDSQVPGSIFPCGKNLHPAAKVATLTAPFSPFLRLRRKRKLIEKPISLPFSFYQYTGRTASATYWQTVGFMQGVPPAPPRLIQKLIAATPGQGRGFWLYPVLNVMMKKVLFYG